ncbi:hypothetical protein PCE1_000523 [Barthelona sp. PCE]
MPEACVVVIDNSDYARSYDYISSRLEAQLTASGSFTDYFLSSNGENTVGFVTGGGGVLSPCTRDRTKILNSFQKAKFNPSYDIVRAIRLGILTLQNAGAEDHFRKSIVLLVCNPIDIEDEERLQKVQDALKDARIKLVVVSFGRDVTTQNAAVLRNIVDSYHHFYYEEIIPNELITISRQGNLTDLMRATSLFGGANNMMAYVPPNMTEEEQMQQVLEESMQSANVSEPAAAEPAAYTEECGLYWLEQGIDLI